MRLIDAYALQNEIYKSKMQNPHTDPKIARNHESEHDHFMQMVVLQPTAQKEIVWCKDCWKREFDNCPFYEYSMIVQEDDFFCADGEKNDTAQCLV